MAGIDLRTDERLANRCREELDSKYYAEVWTLPEKNTIKTSSKTLKAIQRKLWQASTKHHYLNVYFFAGVMPAMYS